MKKNSKLFVIVFIIFLILVGVFLYCYLNNNKTKNEYYDVIINNARIKKLSGPVTFQILEPNIEVFKRLKRDYNIQLPIVILVGDEHYSSEGQCKNCNIEKNCYPIYSNEFISLLDNLSNKGFSVDIYTENIITEKMREYLLKANDDRILTYLKKKFELYRKNEMLPMLRENILSCYIKELKGTDIYDKFCPSKNIRWHYADVRFNINFKKYSMESKFFYLFNIQEQIKDLVGLIKLQSKLENISTENKNDIDLLTNNFKYKFANYELTRFPRDLNIGIFDSGDSLDDFKLRLFKLKEMNMEVFFESILSLMKNENIDKIIDYFFTINNPEFVNSLIYKQLKDLPNDIKYGILTTMKDYMKIYLNEKIPYLNSEEADNEQYKIAIQNYLTDLIFLIQNYNRITIKHFEAFLAKYYMAYTDNKQFTIYYLSPIKFDNMFYMIPLMLSSFLDLYFISRFIKTQKYSPGYGITMGVFGYAHTNFISHYLVNILGWYTSAYDIKAKDTKLNHRCIDFSKKKDIAINLDYLLDFYKNLN
jgi:hypothetical protein